MKTIDYMTQGLAVAVNYPLDTQWRVAVAAMVVICLAGLLALLPGMSVPDDSDALDLDPRAER